MVTPILIIAIIIAYIAGYLISNIKTRKLSSEIQIQYKLLDKTVNSSNIIMKNYKIRINQLIDSGIKQEIKIKELEKHLHNEQVDSNNKGRSRDKWRSRYETLKNKKG